MWRIKTIELIQHFSDTISTKVGIYIILPQIKYGTQLKVSPLMAGVVVDYKVG